MRIEKTCNHVLFLVPAELDTTPVQASAKLRCIEKWIQANELDSCTTVGKITLSEVCTRLGQHDITLKPLVHQLFISQT